MKIIPKKTLAVLGVMALSLGFTACSNPGSTGISADEAKTIALEDSGFTEDGVSGLRSDSEKDNNVEYFEVEFRAEGVEYSYEIAKEDGSIISKDSDADGIFGSGSVDSNTTTETTDTPTDTTTSATGAVTIDQAKDLALAKVTGADESHIVINQDRDDGKDVYEGTIIYNGVEYEFEIDAANGNFLSWEEERVNQN